MTDFFEEVMAGPERDGSGRPRLVPNGGTEKVAYQRASSFADLIGDEQHLHIWEKRYLARGLANRPDLIELAAGETYVSSKLVQGKEKKAENSMSGKRLDDIIRRALDTAGLENQSDRGTAVHTYAALPRERSAEAPAALQPYLDGYWAALDREGLVPIATEVFCANDHVMAAGTFDGLYYWPRFDCVVVGDLKTGDRKPGFAIQKSIYANAELCDFNGLDRRPLESLCQGSRLDRSVGLLIDVKEKGTRLFPVDLDRAWKLTRLIGKLGTQMKNNVLMTELSGDKVLTAIAAAATVEELHNLFAQTGEQWHPIHRLAASRRREEIA